MKKKKNKFSRSGSPAKKQDSPAKKQGSPARNFSGKKRRSPSSSRVTPSKEALHNFLTQSGIKVTSKKLTLLWKFHRLLRKRNDELNLTRIRGFENMALKHYVDSLLVRKYMTLPSPLLDLGTGAGFPGIPLKIFSPSLHIILGEKRDNRVEFLKEARDYLELDLEIYPHGVNHTFDLPVQGVITRAVEVVGSTLHRCQKFLPPQGKVIFMKGPGANQELDMAIEKYKSIYILRQNTDYDIPHTSHHRKLVVFEKLLDSKNQSSPD